MHRRGNMKRSAESSATRSWKQPFSSIRGSPARRRSKGTKTWSLRPCGGRAMAEKAEGIPLVLKLEDWPEADRTLLDRLTAKGDIFDDPGPYCDWSRGTRRLRLQGYGQWLSYLARCHAGELHLEPVERIRKDTVAGFIAECDARLKPRSTYNLATSILVIALGAAPGLDWSWLARVQRRLRARLDNETLAQAPAISAGGVFNLALERMRKVERDHALTDLRRAIRFRQALMIAFLIARPVRRRALLAMKIGLHLRETSEGFRLHFPADDMKDRRNHDFPFPPRLIAPMRWYLGMHRPALLGGKTSDHLWIGQYGNPITPDGLSRELPKVTQRILGVELRTHAFRHIVATSIAEVDPEHVGIIRDILGHATLTTSTKHYNRARQIDACNALQRVVRGLAST
ncbi:MAG: site-specific integrase [Alphaproteobacteria bacterium]|nr:MAG: site-specific integrase [Alphaproteobacteria bacterium]